MGLKGRVGERGGGNGKPDRKCTNFALAGLPVIAEDKDRQEGERKTDRDSVV